jgi:SOS-response transcriptional repressor LexA
MSDLSESLALNLSNVQRLDRVYALSRRPAQPNQPVTLDDLLIPRPESTVIFPVRDWASQRFGLSPGDLLLVDRSARPQENHLVIILLNDQLVVEKFINARAEASVVTPPTSPTEQPDTVWGVVTYCILKQG